MPLDFRRVKLLFHAALDLPDRSDCPAFLDRECGDDGELRRRVEELLAAHDEPESALERPLIDGETATLFAGETADIPPPEAETIAITGDWRATIDAAGRQPTRHGQPIPPEA